jgi:hypothetical protein
LSKVEKEAANKQTTEAAAHSKEAAEIYAVTKELEPQQQQLSQQLKQIQKDMERQSKFLKQEQKHKLTAKDYASKKLDEDKAKTEHRAALSKRSALVAIAHIKKKAHRRAAILAKKNKKPFLSKDDGRHEMKEANKTIAAPPPEPTPPQLSGPGSYPEPKPVNLSANVSAGLNDDARKAAVKQMVLSERKKSMLQKMKMAIGKFRQEQIDKKQMKKTEQKGKEQDQKRFFRMSKVEASKRNRTALQTQDSAKKAEQEALEAKTQWEKSRLARDQAEATAKQLAVPAEQSAKASFDAANQLNLAQTELQAATANYKSTAASASKSGAQDALAAAEKARAAMLRAMQKAQQKAATQLTAAAAAQSAKVQADEAQYKADQAVAAVVVKAKDKDAADGHFRDAQKIAEQSKIDLEQGDAQAQLTMQQEAEQKLQAKAKAYADAKQREQQAQAMLKKWAEGIMATDDSPAGRKFRLDMSVPNPLDLAPKPTSFLEIGVPYKIYHNRMHFKQAPTTQTEESDSALSPHVEEVMALLQKRLSYPGGGATGKVGISGELLEEAIGDLTGLEGSALEEAVEKMVALPPLAVQGAMTMLIEAKHAKEAKAADESGAESESSAGSESGEGESGADGESSEGAEPALSEESGESDLMNSLESSELSVESGHAETSSSLFGSPSSSSSSSPSSTDSHSSAAALSESAHKDQGPGVEINVVNHNVMNARSAPGAQPVALPPGTDITGLLPSEQLAMGDPDSYLTQLGQKAMQAVTGRSNSVQDRATSLTDLVASLVGAQLNSPDMSPALPSSPSPSPPPTPVTSTPTTTSPNAEGTAAPFAGVTPVRFRG